MSLEEFLGQLKPIKEGIEQLEQSIEVLTSRAEKTTSAIKPVSVQGGGSDKSDIIVNLGEEKEKLKAKQAEFLEIAVKIFWLVNDLESSNCRKILVLRHIQFMTFEEIGKELKTSSSTISRMHKKSLENLGKMIDLHGDMC